jgi:hypothetical protein
LANGKKREILRKDNYKTKRRRNERSKYGRWE